jgi:N-acetylmuramoyl-L-alanine amidase
MFCLMMRLLSVVYLIMSAWLQAQPARPSPLNLSKLPVSLQTEKNSSNTTKIKPPLCVQKFSIIIDPGHGGHDIGAQSISKPRYQEKSLNLVTAKFVRDYLQQLGYQVFMTREEDKFISLDRRAQIANERKPTLFVSIHYNSAPITEAQGIEVFFYQSKEKKNRAIQSKRLAQFVLKNMLEETKAKSRGIKQGNFLVIRQTKMPAILVEGGFVTNEAELQNLKDPTYLKRLAWGIVRGIEEYLCKLNSSTAPLH